MLQLKGLLARNLYENSHYFDVIAPMDTDIDKALELINDEAAYNNLLKPQQ
jgi:hypothetical protein